MDKLVKILLVLMLLLILLTGVLVVSLILGAGSDSSLPRAPEATVAENTEPTPESIAAAPEPTAQPTPTDNQIGVIIENRQLWEHSESADVIFWYAVTDLNGNGRYEIFSAATQEIGVSTFGTLYEVSEDMTTLVPYNQTDGTNDLPEVKVESVTRYTENGGDNRVFYLFTDIAKSGLSDVYEAKVALRLADGQLEKMRICYKQTESYVDGTLYTNFFDGNGNQLDEEVFNNCLDICFAGFNADTINLGWFKAGTGSYEAMLTLSYKVFCGELARMPE